MSRDEVTEALSPLVEYCRQLPDPPREPDNRAIQTLQTADPAGLQATVTRVLRDVQRDRTAVRSPFGVLVAAADRGEPEIMTPPAEPAATPDPGVEADSPAAGVTPVRATMLRSWVHNYTGVLSIEEFTEFVSGDVKEGRITSEEAEFVLDHARTAWGVAGSASGFDERKAS